MSISCRLECSSDNIIRVNWNSHATMGRKKTSDLSEFEALHTESNPIPTRYVLISSFVLLKMIRDPLIKGRASDLWQFLYYHSLDSCLEIETSVQVLAKEMSYSKRTIQRYLRSLMDAGYLEIKSPRKMQDGETLHCFRVGFPEQHQEKLNALLKRLEKEEGNTEDRRTPQSFFESCFHSSSLSFEPIFKPSLIKEAE